MGHGQANQDHVCRDALLRCARALGLLRRLPLQPLHRDQRRSMARRCSAVGSRAEVCLLGLRQARCRRPAGFQLGQAWRGHEGFLVTSKSQGARPRSDYFLCVRGDAAMETRFRGYAPLLTPCLIGGTNGSGATQAGAIFAGRFECQINSDEHRNDRGRQP